MKKICGSLLALLLLTLTVTAWGDDLRLPGGLTTIEEKSKAVMATAVRNPDGSLAVVVINQGNAPVGLDLAVDGKHYKLSINKEAIQTIVL